MNPSFFLQSPAFMILCLISIYSLALMFNQAKYMLGSKENVRELILFLEDYRKEKKDIEIFASSRVTPHRRLLAAGLKHFDKPEETLIALLSEEAKSLRWEAEQRLSALGTIANTAPFIGLFGTVVGVIHAFHAISKAAGAGPAVVAAGISEALITTAAGLFVAVPAVFAYNFFLKRARRLSIELEHVATLLIHRVHK
jgi:biopolymer transport protein ExbB/TolQ